ncbi:MAG TPA: hypothetical protein VKB43_08535 [Gaiellaceae bacterium]|nr:hypothetical protein [Gaiellaceae bacterium]
MATPSRLLLAAGVAVLAALVSAACAFACGPDGYSYAGFSARDPAYGISAQITSLVDLPILHGHVAGWVGVGGPGEGPGGSDEWLQVGLSGFAQVTGSDAYYEVARPHQNPVYHQLAGGLPAGKTVTVAVLEIPHRPSWWRVWRGDRPASKPIWLPESHDRWMPLATAESWDGGTGAACNSFLYDFHHVQIAHAPGGHWRRLSAAYAIKSLVTRVRRAGAAFLAAEGAGRGLMRGRRP